ncbi:MAG TPA: condensation domain-containing protein, partial [Candidatus Thermoplasmatota archaeon]|nr:condensation domain-containing protein [Candidatus Thermoplasmatota archaeon]
MTRDEERPGERDLSSAKAKLLAKWLSAKPGAAPETRTATIPRHAGPEPAPLSFSQERLWFLHQLDPASPAYNMIVAHRLEGALDVPVLEKALNEVLRRQEALRTTFSEASGSPRQIVAPYAPLALPVVDLTALPEAEREREAD